MKKKIIIPVVICFMIAISSLPLKPSSSSIKIFNIDLAGIEALAQIEGGGGNNRWYQPQTEKCRHELGGGMFESSVQRVCVLSLTPNSCTAVECGKAFY